MTIEQFIQALLDEAKKQGIEAAEVYLASGDSFRAMCVQGEIANYSVNATRGLSLRGLYQGKMGYAATEAFDEDAVSRLVQAVKESAELIEDEDVQEIYPGDKEYPQIEDYNPALDQVEESRKLQLIKDIEKKALAMDERITALNYNMISTSSGETRIVNSYGLNLAHRDNMAVVFVSATAKEGERVSTGAGSK